MARDYQRPNKIWSIRDNNLPFCLKSHSDTPNIKSEHSVADIQSKRKEKTLLVSIFFKYTDN